MTVELSNFKRNILEETESNSFVINLKEFNDEVTADDLEFLLGILEKNENIGFLKFNNEVRKKNQFSDLFEKIEKQIFKNNCSFNVFPSDYFCGQLILHSLKSEKKTSHIGIDLTNQGWKMETSFDKSDDFCYLYENEKRKQLVLVFIGISLSPSDYFNQPITANLLNSLKQKEINYEQLSFKCLVNAIKLSEQKRYSLTVTGYSFGSWLAESAVLAAQFKLNKKNIKAVLFESPGSFEYFKQSSTYLRSNTNQFRLKSSDITVYLTEPNFLNTLDEHIGSIFLVRTDPVSYKSICEEICQTSDNDEYSLSIRNLLQQLESFKVQKFNEYDDQFKQLKILYSEKSLDKYVAHFESPFKIFKSAINGLFNNIAYFLNGNASLNYCGLKFILSEFDCFLKEINQKEKCFTWPKLEQHFNDFHQNSFQHVIANLRNNNFQNPNLTHDFMSIVLDRYKELLKSDEIDRYLRKLQFINLTNLSETNLMNFQLKNLKALYKIERSNDDQDMIVSLNPAFSVNRIRQVLQRLLNIDMHLRLNYEENWPKLTAALKIFSKLYYHSKSCFLSYIYSNPL